MWTISEKDEVNKFLKYSHVFLFCVDCGLMSESERAEQIWNVWNRCGQSSVESS